jgi:hypothetical protein
MTSLHRAIALAAVWCTVGAAVAADPDRRMVIVPVEEARFVPLDPARPDGSQMAVVWGDPSTGPSAVYLKFKKGVGRLHIHTADYHLVVIRGTMKHWGADGSESAAKPLGPGAYWFQPGGKPHADACLSDECLMYVGWSGKRDSRPVEPVGPAAK